MLDINWGISFGLLSNQLSLKKKAVNRNGKRKVY